MRKVLTTASAAIFMAGAVSAADLSGSADIDMTRVNGNVVATPSLTFDLGSEAGDVSIKLKESGGNIVIDRYALGTEVGNVNVTFGDQKDLFQLGAGLEVVGADTLANPAEAAESVIVSAAGVSILVGLTDIRTDVSDVANFQAATELALGGLNLGLVVDYNKTTEDYTFGGNTEFGAASLAVTYSDAFAYELGYNFGDVDVFANGDESDVLQNIGGGYKTSYNNVELYAEVGYNLDSEDVTPAAGISFKF